MDGLIQFFSEYNYDGIAYGLIDNGVLGFSTLLGIDIDRYFDTSMLDVGYCVITIKIVVICNIIHLCLKVL